MKRIKYIATIVMACLGFSSCDSVDCTLYNTVLCQMAFYDNNGLSVEITDTLTVTAAGTDSILYNKGLKTHSVGLPLSYHNDCDTLCLRISGRGYELKDIIYISKTNREHFESLNCPVNMFHEITGVSSTNNVIDSVRITSPSVIYNNGENIKIYLHTAAE